MLNREWLEQCINWLLGTPQQQQWIPVKAERVERPEDAYARRRAQKRRQLEERDYHRFD